MVRVQGCFECHVAGNEQCALDLLAAASHLADSADESDQDAPLLMRFHLAQHLLSLPWSPDTDGERLTGRRASKIQWKACILAPWPGHLRA